MTALNLGPTARDPGITLDFFRQAWTSPSTWAVMGNTVIFALGSTCLAMLIGVFFAFMVERTDMPMKSFAYAVVPLTIAIPGLLYGIAWVLLLSPRIGLFNLALLGLFGKDSGLLTSWAGIGFSGPPIEAYSMGGMIFVDAIRGVGVVFLMTVGMFRNMDPTLEEAAMVSGAAPRGVARLITLKLMLPGILAAFIYSLTGSLETFEIPAIMGLPANINLLSTKIYLLNKSDDEATASAIGIVFILMAILFVCPLQSRHAPHRELQHRERQGVPPAGDAHRAVSLRRRRARLAVPGGCRDRSVFRHGVGQYSTLLRGAKLAVGGTDHLRGVHVVLHQSAGRHGDDQHAAAGHRRADRHHAALLADRLVRRAHAHARQAVAR